MKKSEPISQASVFGHAGIPAQSSNSNWYALMRRDSREIKDMIVAWLTPSEMGEQLRAYTSWDTKATGTTTWEVIRFPRKERADYFRTQKRQEDPKLIEYHWVLEDMEASSPEVLERIP